MKKSKKILIIYSGFIKNGGGVVTHLKHLKSILDEMGYNVDVFSMDNIAYPIKYIFPLIERIINRIIPPQGFIIRMRLTRWYFNRFLSNNYDYYIFEDIYTAPNKLLNRSLLFMHSIKTDNLQAFKSINKHALKSLHNIQENIIKNQKRHIYVVSEEYKNKVCDLYNIKNLNVLSNFISYEIKNTLEWNKRENNILFVGNITQGKNPIFLLKVAKELVNMNINFKLYIIGKEQEIKYSTLTDFINNNGLQYNVQLLGKLENKEVIELMKKSKMLVLPSIQETFGFVFLEAKLCGCKVIATRGLDIPKNLVDIECELNQELWVNGIKDTLSYDDIMINNKNLLDYLPSAVKGKLIRILEQL